MTEDDILHVTLQKRDKGQTWSSPILGQGQLDPYASDLEQKRLMLQRFQEEVIWLSSTEIYVSYVAFSYHLGIPAVASVEVFTRFLLPSCSFMLIHWRVNCYLLFFTVLLLVDSLCPSWWASHSHELFDPFYTLMFNLWIAFLVDRFLGLIYIWWFSLKWLPCGLGS